VNFLIASFFPPSRKCNKKNRAYALDNFFPYKLSIDGKTCYKIIISFYSITFFLLILHLSFRVAFRFSYLTFAYKTQYLKIEENIENRGKDEKEKEMS
jgi:hypothetical protein